MATTTALLSPLSSPLISLQSRCYLENPNVSPNPNSSTSLVCHPISQHRGRRFRFGVVAVSNICEQETLALDARSLKVKEYLTEAELLAAVRLRIRTFYEFNQETYNIEVVQMISSKFLSLFRELA